MESGGDVLPIQSSGDSSGIAHRPPSANSILPFTYNMRVISDPASSAANSTSAGCIFFVSVEVLP